MPDNDLQTSTPPPHRVDVGAEPGPRRGRALVEMMMKTHVDTAAAIRAEGTNLFLTRRGQFLPMGADTLFLEEDADTTTLNTWLGEARRTGVPEVVRVSRVIDLVD